MTDTSRDPGTKREHAVPVKVVFDVESYPPRPIGTYLRSDESVIVYYSPVGEIEIAPEDCVVIVPVDVPMRQVPFVIVLRDPDASNEYRTWGAVQCYDIDAGYSDLRDEDEYREWAESHLASADEIEKTHPEAAAYIREVVESYRGD